MGRTLWRYGRIMKSKIGSDGYVARYVRTVVGGRSHKVLVSESEITLNGVRAAAQRLRSVARHTPLLELSDLSDLLDVPVYAKLENLQRTGSFKFRGAYTRINALSAEERARGVITYSSGNHAQGVACAAQLAGIHAVIVMPRDTVPAKVRGTLRYGAEIVYCGYESVERQVEAERLAAKHGYVIVPPFDDPLIVTGQATVGLEIVEDLPTVDTVIAPVGGGGLLSGVSLATKESLPSSRVIGIEPESGADAQQSLRAGHICDWPAGGRSVADGLRARHIGTLNFHVMQHYVDDIVTVSEEEILDAVVFLHDRAKLVVEPSGAVGIAALRAGKIGGRSGPIVVVLSGGNIDNELLCKLLLSQDTGTA